MKLKIEYIKAGELKAYANNAKTHPAEQVEQIRKSIEQFGFNDPIAVWKDNEIIEGHGRLLAALEIGGGGLRCPYCAFGWAFGQRTQGLHDRSQ